MLGWTFNPRFELLRKKQKMAMNDLRKLDVWRLLEATSQLLFKLKFWNWNELITSYNGNKLQSYQHARERKKRKSFIGKTFCTLQAGGKMHSQAKIQTCEEQSRGKRWFIFNCCAGFRKLSSSDFSFHQRPPLGFDICLNCKFILIFPPCSKLHPSSKW